jgi:hypothetical protein
METNFAAIIDYSISVILMTIVLIYIKRTQPPQKVFFGLSVSTIIKMTYLGIAIFLILIIATFLK